MKTVLVTLAVTVAAVGAFASTASADTYHRCPSSVATVTVNAHATCAQARTVVRWLTVQRTLKPVVGGRQWYCTRTLFDAEFLRCAHWPTNSWVYVKWRLA